MTKYNVLNAYNDIQTKIFRKLFFWQFSLEKNKILREKHTAERDNHDIRDTKKE